MLLVLAYIPSKYSLSEPQLRYDYTTLYHFIVTDLKQCEELCNQRYLEGSPRRKLHCTRPRSF